MRNFNYLKITLLFLVLCSCLPKKEKDKDSSQITVPKNGGIEKSNNGITSYNEDNFKFEAEFEFVQTFKTDTINSYQYQDLVNIVSYRINVANNTNDLNLLGLKKFDSAFIKNYFDEYIRGLKNDETEFKRVNFLNEDALIYEYIVTNNSLIENKKALLKSRILIVLNINKVYTLSIVSEPEKLDQAFNDFIKRFSFIDDGNNEKYFSSKYQYEIIFPSDYSLEKASGKHIDLKLVKRDGISMLVNISDRFSDEYRISAHDYTKEYLESSFKQTNPDINIVKTEKTFIDNNKAYLIHYIVPNENLKALEIYFFKGDFAYVLTATSRINNFTENESTFLNTFKSLKFK